MSLKIEKRGDDTVLIDEDYNKPCATFKEDGLRVLVKRGPKIDYVVIPYAKIEEGKAGLTAK